MIARVRKYGFHTQDNFDNRKRTPKLHFETTTSYTRENLDEETDTGPRTRRLYMDKIVNKFVFPYC